MAIITNNASVIYNYFENPQTFLETSNILSISLKNTQNIKITKQANPTTFSQGSIITYSIKIENTGPNFLTGVRIIDNLGFGNLSYVLGSATLTTLTQTYSVNPISTNPLTFTLQQLNPGESMILTYNSQVIFNPSQTIETITNSVKGIGYTSNRTYSSFSNFTIFKN